MSSLQMPKVDISVLSRKDKIASDLSSIINSNNVLSSPDELRPFETDGLTAYRQIPLLVVMPETVDEVSRILKYCNENKIKVVPRGAGTGLSGGSMPLEDCVLIAMGKFNKVLEIDYENASMEEIIEQLEYAIEQHPSFLKVLTPEEIEEQEKLNKQREW